MNWRNTREYRLWRVGVIRRDKVCKVCNERKGRHAHHLNHATYFPEQRFNLKNGICLCKNCHSHFHNDYKNSTREKCTVKDYFEYYKLARYFYSVAFNIVNKRLESIL